MTLESAQNTGRRPAAPGGTAIFVNHIVVDDDNLTGVQGFHRCSLSYGSLHADRKPAEENAHKRDKNKQAT
jgi:hypothetical protein